MVNGTLFISINDKLQHQIGDMVYVVHWHCPHISKGPGAPYIWTVEVAEVLSINYVCDLKTGLARNCSYVLDIEDLAYSKHFDDDNVYSSLEELLEKTNENNDFGS